jgi:hypothetical protein
MALFVDLTEFHFICLIFDRSIPPNWRLGPHNGIFLFFVPTDRHLVKYMPARHQPRLQIGEFSLPPQSEKNHFQ